MQQYVCGEFINQNTNTIPFIINDGMIIIERDIVINKGVSSNKYNAGKTGLMTMTKNNHMIVRAFAYAWKFREVYERTGSLEEVVKTESISWRMIYKYLGLAYLSPRLVNKLMNGKIQIPLRELFVIASKYDGFKEQETAFNLN